MDSRRTAVLWFALTTVAGSATAQSLELAPCTVEGTSIPARCGEFAVPENRARPDGRTIRLNVLVLPATSGKAAADPLVFLPGGGVLPATRMAPFLTRALPELRKTRDILLVDQRGTGRSNPLTCDLALPRPGPGGATDRAAIASIAQGCIRQLEQSAELAHYNTNDAMRDLDAVRQALGYQQLNLYGVSYGTKTAREYARLFPDRVRSVVLHGVVPRDFPWWFELPRVAELGLDSLNATCARDAGCHKRFGDVRKLAESVAAKAEAAPVRVALSRPGNPGVFDSVTVNGAVVRNVFYSMLYESVFLRGLPLVAELALQGDWEPLARWAQPPPGPPAIPRGIFFNIVCAEQLGDWGGPIKQGQFFGTTGIPAQLAVCEQWPRFPIDPGIRREFPSAVPTLVLTGAHDHVTAPEFGERLMPTLERGRHIVLPERGHNDADRCMTELVERFVENPDPAAVDPGCAALPPKGAFSLTKAELGNR